MILPRLAQKMMDQKPAVGTSIRFHDPALVERIGHDWDFVWLDLQHGTIGMEHLANLIRACDHAGVTSLVRLPRDMPAWVGIALDMDVGGVIVAQINTVEQARRAVQAAKFSPLGERSYGGRRIIDRHGRDYATRANREQVLVVQIESRAALDGCEAIAAVEGVDGLMVGPDDLHLESGMPPDTPLFSGYALEAVRRVCTACKSAGKIALGLGSENPVELKAVMSAGLNWVSVSADVLYVVKGSAAARRAAAEVLT